ncbi:WD repeat-containing protein 19-like protein [Sarcoptes scabiei]|uniref:WD repeat-containing protein 19-like protein n=1 Tax=Sarcoptes scabiei TaxID=52283 RepID=A0A132AAL5_SARSC|nr:WD repeat-containing protein 19-like protein [Sarcoptes scabiei]
MIVPIEIEPSKIAIGPFHLAVVLNNKIWLYNIVGNELMNQISNELEFTDIIKDLRLNETYLALLFNNGTLQFQLIEQSMLQNQPQTSPPNNLVSNSFSTSTDDHSKNYNRFQIFVYPDSYDSMNQSTNENIKRNVVTAFFLTQDFLIFSLENGSIIYFVLQDWNHTTIYRHDESIQMLQANFNGTKLIIVDRRNEAFVFNAYSEQLVKIDSDHVPTRPIKILWESWLNDRFVFTISDNRFISVFSISSTETIEQPSVDYVGRMKIPSGQYPLLLYNGVVVCQTKSGKTSNFVLSTHDYSIKENLDSDSYSMSSKRIAIIKNLIKLRRYQDAIKICLYLNEKDLWDELAKSAIRDMEINVAIRVYKQIHKYSMVFCLERVALIEENRLVCGLLAEILGDFDLAQKHFLSSSRPMYALEMRKNLQQWKEALALARHLSPQEIPKVCYDLAIQQEFRQEFAKALENFKLGLDGLMNYQQNNDEEGDRKIESIKLSPPSSSVPNETVELCLAGIARNSIRCGNLNEALSIASKLTNKELINELATILESFNHLQESALFYEKCSEINRAASLYLRIGNQNKLGQLIPMIDDPEILYQYAQWKETKKQYRQAMEIYSRAQHWLDVVRINLDHLNNPGEAARIVRENSSVEGAKLVARFFQNLNKMNAAIEFLIISNCFDDAYNLALTTHQMDVYADLMQHHLNSDLNQQDLRTIAIYYEQENNFFKAGKFYCFAKQYKKGVKLLLKSIQIDEVDKNNTNNNINSIMDEEKINNIKNNSYDEDGHHSDQNGTDPIIHLDEKLQKPIRKLTKETEALSLAIDSATKAKDEEINRMILDLLLGETDGIPRDFKYLFRFYMKMQLWSEAAKTSIIIAREEQNSGNYRNAHQLLFQMCSELKLNQKPIPSEMIFNLMLVHCYLLAKMWIRIEGHDISSKLLIRIYENVKQFPAHSIQILSFVVIECLRAGYQNNALKFAYALMRIENRDQINPKLRKPIENLVRKSAKRPIAEKDLQRELQLSSSPCPNCSIEILDDQFSCNNCRTSIPFCIASGMHIHHNDLTRCPNCLFPANKTELIRLLFGSNSPQQTPSNIGHCPMCEKEIHLEQIAECQMEDIINLHTSG